jgi:hypothetical protein
MNHRDSRGCRGIPGAEGFQDRTGSTEAEYPRSQEGFQGGRENQGKKINSLEGFSENREIPGRQMDVQ